MRCTQCWYSRWPWRSRNDRKEASSHSPIREHRTNRTRRLGCNRASPNKRSRPRMRRCMLRRHTRSLRRSFACPSRPNCTSSRPHNRAAHRRPCRSTLPRKPGSCRKSRRRGTHFDRCKPADTNAPNRSRRGQRSCRPARNELGNRARRGSVERFHLAAARSRTGCRNSRAYRRSGIRLARPPQRPAPFPRHRLHRSQPRQPPA